METSKRCEHEETPLSESIPAPSVFSEEEIDLLFGTVVDIPSKVRQLTPAEKQSVTDLLIQLSPHSWTSFDSTPVLQNTLRLLVRAGLVCIQGEIVGDDGPDWVEMTGQEITNEIKDSEFCLTLDGADARERLRSGESDYLSTLLHIVLNPEHPASLLINPSIESWVEKTPIDEINKPGKKQAGRKRQAPQADRKHNLNKRIYNAWQKFKAFCKDEEKRPYYEDFPDWLEDDDETADLVSIPCGKKTLPKALNDCVNAYDVYLRRRSNDKA